MACEGARGRVEKREREYSACRGYGRHDIGNAAMQPTVAFNVALRRPVIAPGTIRELCAREHSWKTGLAILRARARAAAADTPARVTRFRDWAHGGGIDGSLLASSPTHPLTVIKTDGERSLRVICCKARRADARSRER